MAKRIPEPKLIKGLKLSGNWDNHADLVRPAIKELDRRQVESLTVAHFIVITNSTK